MEQIERTQRYLQRIRNIYSGIMSSSTHDKDSYDDDVISFFIHCYHVRDWIIHLNKIDVTAKEVDSFINEHMPLKICADFANGSKHCELNRSMRTNSQPHIIGTKRNTSVWYTSNGGGEHMKSKYTISAHSEIYDALDLAEKCVELWLDYSEQLRIKYKSLNSTLN